MYLLQKQKGKGSVVWLLCVSVWVGAGASTYGACVIMCHQRTTLAAAPLVLSAFCLTQGLSLVRFQQVEQVSRPNSVHGSSSLCLAS